MTLLLIMCIDIYVDAIIYGGSINRKGTNMTPIGFTIHALAYTAIVFKALLAIIVLGGM